jgi:hypothetical protein
MRVEIFKTKLVGGTTMCWSPTVPVGAIFDLVEENAIRRFKGIASDYLVRHDLVTSSWLTFAPDIEFAVKHVAEAPAYLHQKSGAKN